MTEDRVLEVDRLHVAFDDFQVIRDVSFEVERGEIFVIMGPSGCGKTTLLKTMVGLLRPASGEVRFKGRVVHGRGLDEYRRSIGMVFQQGALLNSVSLEENVALPLTEHSGLPSWMVEEVVKMKLAQVGLLEARTRLPMELSGGMRKRAGIARALALEPELLFFDEPTGGLDPMTADGIDNLILELRDTLGVTIVVVTHELASIFKIADRILMLKDAGIAVLGSREEVRGVRDDAVRRFIERTADSEEGAADAFLSDVEGDRG